MRAIRRVTLVLVAVAALHDSVPAQQPAPPAPQAQPVQPQAQLQQQPGARQTLVDNPTFDVLHPNHFVKVFEYPNKGARRAIHDNYLTDDCGFTVPSTDAAGSDSDNDIRESDDPTLYKSAIDVEVDFRSRIAIEFDRRFILCAGDEFVGEVTVNGKIQSAGGSRDVSVPGYWEAGQAERYIAVISPRTARRAMGLANEIVRTVEKLESAVTDSMNAELDDSTQISDAEFRMINSDSDLAADGTTAWLRALETRGYLDTIDLPSVLRSGTVWLSANRGVLEGLLQGLTSADSRAAAERIADIQEREASVIVQVATDARDRWLPEMSTFAQATNPGPVEQLAQYNRIANLVELIDTFYLQSLIPDLSDPCARSYYENPANPRAGCRPDESPELDRIDRALSAFTGSYLATLKDTAVLLPVEGAVPGDTLTLRFLNGDTAQEQRQLVVQMRVGEFGVKREVTDSALFIHRDVADVDFNAAQGEAEASGTTTTVEAPEDSNYTPAPGVTLSWTFLPRPEKRAWHVLQPGLGINVSFPQFDSTLATFTPSSGTTPASATFTQTDSDIDVAAGFMFSLFRNRLQFSWGKVLTVEEDRDYFAIGFSFVNLIRRPGANETN